ncbi:MAG: C40 family peptidase [Novosphingobium sp.]
MTVAPAPNRYAGQYALAGPAKVDDPRITPIRGDLADIALAGKLFAPHYVVPMERAVRVPFVALRGSPAATAEPVSELLAGERFLVLDIAGEGDGAWAWGYGAHDRYLGYLALAALGDPASTPRPPRPEGADPVAIAEGLAGTPYVWGGRGGAGLDCSGLVQTVFAANGTVLPRDSDQQAAAGRALGDDEPLRRGDLVFFPGHVAIAVDGETLVHASRERGLVAIEPLTDVVARKGAVTGRRRAA